MKSQGRNPALFVRKGGELSPFRVGPGRASSGGTGQRKAVPFPGQGFQHVPRCKGRRRHHIVPPGGFFATAWRYRGMHKSTGGEPPCPSGGPSKQRVVADPRGQRRKSRRTLSQSRSPGTGDTNRAGRQENFLRSGHGALSCRLAGAQGMAPPGKVGLFISPSCGGLGFTGSADLDPLPHDLSSTCGSSLW